MNLDLLLIHGLNWFLIKMFRAGRAKFLCACVKRISEIKWNMIKKSKVEMN